LILAAIGDLPTDFREIIVLRDMQDHGYEEIAEFLDIPVGTVRSRLHRARMELKDRLRRVLDPTA
jgi:RNA polymerase sigma-70 factor (ECF subfamily)